MQANFLIIPTALLRLYTAKKALFLSYLVAVYKAVKKADNLKNGAFYCCVNAASAATTAQATTQRELLQELQDKGLLSVTYEGANGKRYIKFQPKMQAEFPLLFGFCSTENEHQHESRCAKNGDADARKTGTNNKEYKKKEKLVSLKKDTRIGARNFFVSDESQKTTASVDALELSQKSCAKKGFSIAEGIWVAYQDFCQYNQLSCGKLTNSALGYCQSIADQLAVVLKDKQDKDVLRAWYHLLGGVLVGRNLEGTAAGKDKIRNSCAYYCKETKSIALFDAQLDSLVKLVQQVHTFMVSAAKPASGKSSRAQADAQIAKNLAQALAKSQPKSLVNANLPQDNPKNNPEQPKTEKAPINANKPLPKAAPTFKELQQLARAKYKEAIAAMQLAQPLEIFEFPTIPAFCQELQNLAAVGLNKAQQRAQSLLDAAKAKNSSAADFVICCLDYLATQSQDKFAAQRLKSAALGLDMQPALALAALAQQTISQSQK